MKGSVVMAELGSGANPLLIHKSPHKDKMCVYACVCVLVDIRHCAKGKNPSLKPVYKD